MLAELNLPKAGMPMDMYQSGCHPANQRYLHESNPRAAQPPEIILDPSAGERFQYGGFEVTKNPMNAPMSITHPFMNHGLDLDPGQAILAGMKFGNDRGPPADSEFSLGWPGSHVECPTCVREKAQHEFDEQNRLMQDAALRGEDWAFQARRLTLELFNVQRAVSYSSR